MNQPDPQRPPVAVPEEELIDVKDLLLQVWRIRYYILLSLAITLSLAYLIIRYSVPVYQVSSKFFVKEKESPLTGIFETAGLGAMGGDEMVLANQIIILKSRPIAEAALDRLDFDVEYVLEGVFKQSELYRNTPLAVEVDWTHPQLSNGFLRITWTDRQTFRLSYVDAEYTQVFPDNEGRDSLEDPASPSQTFRFGDWVELPMNRFRVALTGADEEGELLIRLRDMRSLLDHYTGEDLSISPMDKQSTILDLTLKTVTPAKGRDYLNTLQEVYLENELQEKNAMASNTIDFIDAQLVVLSDSLLYIENRLENFRSNNATYDISSEGSAIFEQLKELETELAQQRFKRSYYQQLRRYLEREDYNQIAVPSGLGIEDPILNTLIQNLLELQAEKSMHASVLTEISPPVREVNRKIADMNRSILELLENVDQNAELLIQDLEERIARIETAFGSLPQTEQNLLRIRREFALNEELYTFLLQKRAEAAITRASNTPSNKIIETALVDPEPISPKRFRIFLLCLILGTILPVGISIGRNYFNTKIKDAKELEKKSQLSLLCSINQSKEKDNLVVLRQPRSGVTEAFRSLRANLNFILPREQPVVVMITSSISGEGKTFSSINLASVYALSGKKTLLIGCDLRKPKIFEDFGLKNKRGLSTYLSGQEPDTEAILQTTAYENLHIIASGPIPPNPAELLITDRFAQLLQQMRERYEVIILDTPPVGLVSESLDLLHLADACLFVVRYNYSQKLFIEHINALKKQQSLNKAYLIFNGVEKKAYRYGYGYGYGYGYYAEDVEDRNSWTDRLGLK
ncbi:GumC family protein [Cyclobacterium xiamenense]|uniref:GumC family protein n=1 Tax=Cyclobacterium xiamenense TaxID=1297121 RepID=UPI0035D0EB6D